MNDINQSLLDQNNKNDIEFVSNFEMIDLTNNSNLSSVIIDKDLIDKVSECIMVTEDLMNNNTNETEDANLPAIFSRDFLKKLDNPDAEIDDNFFKKYQNDAENEFYSNKFKCSNNNYLDQNYELQKTDPFNRFQNALNSSNRLNEMEHFNRIDKKIQDKEIIDLTDKYHLFSRDLIEVEFKPLAPILDADKFIQAFNDEEVKEAKELIDLRNDEDLYGDLQQSFDSLNTSASDAITKLYEQQCIDFPLNDSFQSNKDSLNLVENDLYLSDDDEKQNQSNAFKEKIVHDETSLKDVYKVEKLLAKRYKKNGKLEYLVKYENLDDDQMCWESEKSKLN